MPIKTAADVIWLQPGATVLWTWNCHASDLIVDLDPIAPPPLYFWFIPLASSANRPSLSASSCRTYYSATDEGPRWAFEWRLANSGTRALALKINIWTPLGAKPCAFAS
jgi:hypothetical protein